MKNRFSISLVPLLYLSSCISTYDLMESHATDVAYFSTSDLNGNYSNSEDSTRRTLWNTLYSCKSFKSDKNPIPKNAVINLYFENDKMLVAKAIEKDSVLNTIELKGKMKGDYFSIRIKLFFIPIPAFWIHKETIAVIGQGQSGNVIVKYADFNAGWILVFAGGGLHGYYQDEYPKLLDIGKN